MLDARKAYDFTIRFGTETDTLDGEGEVVARSDRRPSSAEIEAVLPAFTGTIEQVPPAYSALKVGGRRAYDLARAGEEVQLAPRQVTIHELVVRHPRECGNDGENEVTLFARVSKGTYIRSLAREIAHALATVGHVVMLRRVEAGPFTLDQAISLDKLAELATERQLEQALLPLAAGLDDIPALTVTPDQARLLRQGQKLVGATREQGLLLAIDRHGVPVALAEASGPELRVVRGFNL